MKLICPWCGAHGHDGATGKERETPPSFEFFGMADDNKLYAFKCLRCGEGVGATRAMGRIRPLDPEGWQEHQEHVTQVMDPLLHNYFPSVIDAQGIAGARRLMSGFGSGNKREFVKAMYLCNEVGLGQEAEDGFRRMEEDAAAGGLRIAQPPDDA
jgi:hypothetical protein